MFKCPRCVILPQIWNFRSAQCCPKSVFFKAIGKSLCFSGRWILFKFCSVYIFDQKHFHLVFLKQCTQVMVVFHCAACERGSEWRAFFGSEVNFGKVWRCGTVCWDECSGQGIFLHIRRLINVFYILPRPNMSSKFPTHCQSNLQWHRLFHLYTNESKAKHLQLASAFVIHIFISVTDTFLVY